MTNANGDITVHIDHRAKPSDAATMLRWLADYLETMTPVNEPLSAGPADDWPLASAEGLQLYVYNPMHVRPSPIVAETHSGFSMGYGEQFVDVDGVVYITDPGAPVKPKGDPQ